MSKISNATAAEAKTAQHVAEQNIKSTPNAGTTGEHASPDETLQKGHAHKKQTEFHAQEVKGAAAKATRQQVYGDGDGKFTDNSNPKAREGNTWGVRNDETEGRN
jgi:hypothetical protein